MSGLDQKREVKVSKSLLIFNAMIKKVLSSVNYKEKNRFYFKNSKLIYLIFKTWKFG